MKTIEINGVTFEYYKKHMTNDELADIAYSTHSIHYFYKRCSEIKLDIYNNWCRWANDVNRLYYFGVSSANTNTFTLRGIIERPNENDILLVITKDHNRAYEIV